MTWHKHRHVMCRVASFCCNNDLQKESKCQYLYIFFISSVSVLMTQCGRAAKVYVVIVVWNVRQRTKWCSRRGETESCRKDLDHLH